MSPIDTRTDLKGDFVTTRRVGPSGSQPESKPAESHPLASRPMAFGPVAFKPLVVGPLILGLALLLGSFQNCSLHQSDARKQFEKMLASGRTQFCLPYLSNSAAVEIFETTNQVTTEWRPDADGTPCMISDQGATRSSDVVVCHLLESSKVLVDQGAPNPSQAPAGVLAIYPSPTFYNWVEVTSREASTIGAGFVVGGATTSGGFSIEAHAGVPHSELGVRCRSSFEDTIDFADNQELGTKRTRALAEEMARAL